DTEVSLKNFEDILNTPKEPRPQRPVSLASLSRVEFENVIFQHQSATTKALDGISFTGSLGETIAFVGPSGSGKTTLVKLLVGLYRPQAGDIRYDGFSIEDVDLNQLRERIGLVTQDTQLFSGSIRENLLFVNPNASDEDCMTVLNKAACQSLLRRADKGLDTVIGEGGIKVSGGEKQRLSIARALPATSRIVRLIASSVSESSDDVASSNTSRCGLRSRARAIESLCFSPPETLMPPSPITVSSPLSARARRACAAAFLRTSRHSASVACGFTNFRFSRMVPEKSCVSCVTSPIRSRRRSRS